MLKQKLKKLNNLLLQMDGEELDQLIEYAAIRVERRAKNRPALRLVAGGSFDPGSTALRRTSEVQELVAVVRPQFAKQRN